MAELAELLERIEKATGPDRQIDGLLYQLDEVIKTCWPHWDSFQREELTPRYTASIDAALALVERLLPGSNWTRHHPADGDGRYRMEVWWPDGKDWNFTEAWQTSTIPLAVLSALLRALSNTQTGGKL